MHDKVTEESFSSDDAVVARLDAIFAFRMRLCHLVRNLSVHDELGVADDVVELVADMSEEFNDERGQTHAACIKN